MPIYEYKCPTCQATFEELVRSEREERGVRCPQCGAANVERQLSVFAARQDTRPATGPAGGCGQCCRADGSCPLAE